MRRNTVRGRLTLLGDGELGSALQGDSTCRYIRHQRGEGIGNLDIYNAGGLIVWRPGGGHRQIGATVANGLSCNCRCDSAGGGGRLEKSRSAHRRRYCSGPGGYEWQLRIRELA